MGYPVKVFKNKQGSFGDYVINGELWRHADGSAVWRMIVTSPSSTSSDARVNLACHVSVDNDEIQCTEIGTGFPDVERIKVGQVVTNIAPSIKEAVHAAKAAWMGDHQFISVDEAAKVRNTTTQFIEDLVHKELLRYIVWHNSRCVSRRELEGLSREYFGGLYLVK